MLYSIVRNSKDYLFIIFFKKYLINWFIFTNGYDLKALALILQSASYFIKVIMCTIATERMIANSEFGKYRV